MKANSSSTTDGSSAKQQSEKTAITKAKMVKLPLGPPMFPLKTQWVLWTQDIMASGHNGRGGGGNNLLAAKQNWTANLQEEWCFDSAEGFSILRQTITPVSRLSPGNDYFLFKEGIEPSWEHPANAYGGRWVLVVPNRTSTHGQAFNKKLLEDCWMQAAKAAVGAQFGEDDAVCGVMVSVRPKQGKVALWLNDANNHEAVRRLGEVFKSKMLEMPHTNSSNIHFESHQQSIAMSSPAH